MKKYILRTITLPVIILLALIRCVVWVADLSISYLKHGGEFIAYDKQVNPTTIRDNLGQLLKKEKTHDENVDDVLSYDFTK